MKADILLEVEIKFLDGETIQRRATMAVTEPRRFDGDTIGPGQKGFLTLVTRSAELVPMNIGGREREVRVTMLTEAYNLATVASWKSLFVGEENSDGTR